MGSEDFDPGPLGEVGREAAGDGRWTLTFVRELKHPPVKVWAALTDADQLVRWAPYTADRSLASTGEAVLTMVDGPDGQAMKATVTRADRPTLLEYTWGGDTLRWELAPSADGTRLTLQHTMADRDSLPKVAAGWHLCLVVADHLLGGDPIAPIRGEDARDYGWEALAEDYTKRLES